MQAPIGSEVRVPSPYAVREISAASKASSLGPSCGQVTPVQVSPHVKKLAASPLSSPLAVARCARLPPAMTAQAGRLSSTYVANSRSPPRTQGGAQLRPVLTSARVITGGISGSGGFSGRRDMYEDMTGGLGTCHSDQELLLVGSHGAPVTTVLVGSASALPGSADGPAEGLVRAAVAQQFPSYTTAAGYPPQPLLPAKPVGQLGRITTHVVRMERMLSSPKLVSQSAPGTASPGASAAVLRLDSGRGSTGALSPSAASPPIGTVPSVPLSRGLFFTRSG